LRDLGIRMRLRARHADRAGRDAEKIIKPLRV